jgi:hypothetical protein
VIELVPVPRIGNLALEIRVPLRVPFFNDEVNAAMPELRRHLRSRYPQVRASHLAYRNPHPTPADAAQGLQYLHDAWIIVAVLNPFTAKLAARIAADIYDWMKSRFKRIKEGHARKRANNRKRVKAPPNRRREVVISDYSVCPKEIRGVPHIAWNWPRRNLAFDLAKTLKLAKNEKPLQRFFEKYPVALAFGVLNGQHQPFVFSHPPFGTIEGLDSIPDFLICDWTSIGPKWTVVELESPTMRLTNTMGISAKMNRAIQQVKDYRAFFAANVLALEAKGWIGLDGNCGGCVVAGRRTEPRTVKNNQRLSRMTMEGIEIASYDRVVERCRSFQSLLNSQWEKARLRRIRHRK